MNSGDAAGAGGQGGAVAGQVGGAADHSEGGGAAVVGHGRVGDVDSSELERLQGGRGDLLEEWMEFPASMRAQDELVLTLPLGAPIG